MEATKMMDVKKSNRKYYLGQMIYFGWIVFVFSWMVYLFVSNFLTHGIIAKIFCTFGSIGFLIAIGISIGAIMDGWRGYFENKESVK